MRCKLTGAVFGVVASSAALWIGGWRGWLALMVVLVAALAVVRIQIFRLDREIARLKEKTNAQP